VVQWPTDSTAMTQCTDNTSIPAWLREHSMPSSRHWSFQAERACYSGAGAHWLLVGLAHAALHAGLHREPVCACLPGRTLPWGLGALGDFDWKSALPSARAQQAWLDCSFILLDKASTYLQPVFLDSLLQVNAVPSWGTRGAAERGRI